MAPKTIGLSGLSQTKPPFLQYVDDAWRVWSAYNSQLTLGTFILLNNDGTAQRCTINPDNSLNIVNL